MNTFVLPIGRIVIPASTEGKPRFHSSLQSRVADQKPTLWQWRVRLKPDTPRDPWFSHKTWKQLRWRMAEADATEWADKNGCEIEKVGGSAEERFDAYGPRGLRRLAR